MFIIIFWTIEYCGSLAEPNVVESPYLKQIGTDLHPKVDILWTGVCVCVCACVCISYCKYSTVVPN